MRIFRRAVKFATTCGDPQPPKYRWWLVYSNIGFFCSSLFLYLYGKNNSYLFDAIILLYMGLVSSIFHSVQCMKGHRHELTQKFCAADVISCFIIGLYIVIRYSTSIMLILIFLCILPFFAITGKVYILFHSIWHLLAAAFLAFAIVYRNQSNFFTCDWWTW